MEGQSNENQFQTALQLLSDEYSWSIISKKNGGELAPDFFIIKILFSNILTVK